MWHEIRGFLTRLAPADRADALEEIKSKFAAAERGDLEFRNPGGGRIGSHDVDQMAIAPEVLEIRYEARGTDPEVELVPRVHARLYFSEPGEHEGCMVTLCFRWKVPGPEGVAEQNGHIKQAERVLHAWRAGQRP